MASSKSHLDEKDVQILALLQEDGRITHAEIGKRIELSPPSVFQRIKALEKAGVIKAYAALLDQDRLGLRLTAWVGISLALHQEQPIERFRKSILEIPEILECFHISGDSDFLLKVVVKDMREYEKFMREKLLRVKGIGQIRTNFVLGTTKSTTKIPLL
jgi:Lrp/AsnC family leucine-responsive transcriptional regulator